VHDIEEVCAQQCERAGREVAEELPFAVLMLVERTIGLAHQKPLPVNLGFRELEVASVPSRVHIVPADLDAADLAQHPGLHGRRCRTPQTLAPPLRADLDDTVAPGGCIICVARFAQFGSKRLLHVCVLARTYGIAQYGCVGEIWRGNLAGR